MGYRHVKRVIDFTGATILTIILSPILAITALAVKLDSKGPVLFRQDRLGYKGKVFRILKFRSMVVGAESKGTGVYSFKGDSRITKVGRFLRATSIDELPQLFNVLKGEMSFIGPRPALTYHPWPIEDYDEEQKRMFDVLPGITGWAQVHGRKEVPWPERIELNIEYVNRMSFLMDTKIFFMTIYKVLANADNNNVGETAK